MYFYLIVVGNMVLSCFITINLIVGHHSINRYNLAEGQIAT